MLALAICHAVVLFAFFTEVTIWHWVVCGVLYFGRMFAVTGVYHRYFAHRTFKTSRVFQFILAFWAQTSSQRGVLWWAGHHRGHHKHSDMLGDIHSPRLHGFFHAHVGWLFVDGISDNQNDKIRDFAKYPELVLLDKFWYVPPIVLGVLVWALFGWGGLWIGFFFSTVLLWHGTYTINSLSHVFGKRVYPTTDDSKNNFILALITMGEGWHNNHHHYQASCRQGFHWWQIDMTYYLLKAMSWVGLVWDIREPPANVVDGSRNLSSGTRKKRASQPPVPAYEEAA